MTYSHQLLTTDEDETVVAMLYHAFMREPTDIVNVYPIKVGDRFELKKQKGKAKSTGVKITHCQPRDIRLVTDDGKKLVAKGFCTSRWVETEDYDCRPLNFTSYAFHICEKVEVEHRPSQQCLFYDHLYRNVVLGEVEFAVGALAKNSRRYMRTPEIGEDFTLDWRLEGIPSGTKVRFAGITEEKFIRLILPGKVEFLYDCAFVRHHLGWRAYDYFSDQPIIVKPRLV